MGQEVFQLMEHYIYLVEPVLSSTRTASTGSQSAGPGFFACTLMTSCDTSRAVDTTTARYVDPPRMMLVNRVPSEPLVELREQLMNHVEHTLRPSGEQNGITYTVPPTVAPLRQLLAREYCQIRRFGTQKQLLPPSN